MDANENNDLGSPQRTVDEVARKALAAVREEFNQKEAAVRELLIEGIAAFHDVDKYAQKHKESQSRLEVVVKGLGDLDFDRSVLTEALGTSEASLSRRLPAKRRRSGGRRKAGRSNAVAGNQESLSSSSEDNSTPQNIE